MSSNLATGITTESTIALILVWLGQKEGMMLLLPLICLGWGYMIYSNWKDRTGIKK